MIHLKTATYLSLCFFCCLIAACTSPKVAAERDNLVKVELQRRRVYGFEQQDVYFSNNFKSARLNGVERVDDTTFRLLVKAENTPINPSPWYAFKVWSKRAPKRLRLILSYEKAKHRYQPQLHRDGTRWEPVGGLSYNMDSTEASFPLGVDRKATWVAAQEIYDTDSLKQWLKRLRKKNKLDYQVIGKSLLGRDIPAFCTKESDGRRVVVVLSRQHPPEVTGYKAMQIFVGTILEDSPLANRFRQQFQLICVPMINPDGVDEGHWRHSAAGLDLNRDWDHFLQPETKAVRDFLLTHLRRQQAVAIFGLDFHSTYYDVFYTNQPDPENPTHMPGLTDAWLARFEQALGIDAWVRASPNGSNVSKSWMSRAIGAESLTYEVGDNTPLALLETKGVEAARSLMELLLAQ